MDIDFYWPP